MKLHDVRIGSSSPHGRDVRVFIDDREIHGITRVTVDVSVTDVNRVMIEMYAGSINATVQAEAEAELAL